MKLTPGTPGISSTQKRVYTIKMSSERLLMNEIGQPITTLFTVVLTTIPHHLLRPQQSMIAIVCAKQIHIHMTTLNIAYH
jgi:hypothetical protein